MIDSSDIHHLRAIPQSLIFFSSVPSLLSSVERTLQEWNVAFRRGVNELEVAFCPEVERALQGLAESLTPSQLQQLSVVPVLPEIANSGRQYTEIRTLWRYLSQIHAGWVSELIDGGHFDMHFHPIVDVPAQQTFGYECLARGRDAAGGLIEPDALIDAAKKTNLLHNLDRALRIAAIEQSHSKGIDENIFVNFMPASVYDPAFGLRTTVKMVEKCHIPPEKIVFEVVETERTGDLRHLQKILETYRQTGFRVALDDLGAGYSSFILLSEIKPDFVKLDRMLLHDAWRTPIKKTMVATLVEMTNEMNIALVAEGVECEEDYQLCRDLGVRLMQGFYFCKPLANPLGWQYEPLAS